MTSAEPTPSAEIALADLLDEISRKRRAGEPIDLDECSAKHPQCAARLRALWPMLDVLEGLSHTSSPAPGATAAVRECQDTLGDFRILREIGRGGMGVVYEAQQISLHRRVALKVLPFAAVLDPRQLQRFKNEAQAAASLKHPNIVGIYAVGCERGVHYYAMEYVEGQTLAQVIDQLRRASPLPPAGEGPGVRGAGGAGRRSPDPAQTSTSRAGRGSPDPAQTPTGGLLAPDTPQPQAEVSTENPTHRREFFRTVAHLGIQAAEALEHAHEMGVVHRDIKPSNLMVESLSSPASGRGVSPFLPSPARGRGAGGEGENGAEQVSLHLWITDFGLAMTQKDPALTMTGDILGTLRYMSPEQASGERGVLDCRTDVYSLGITLYELATLHPAFAGDDRQALLRQIADDDPPRPRRLNQAIPKDLETILLKAAAKDPQARYAKAQELADDLRRFLEGSPVCGRRPSLLNRAAYWFRRRRPVVWSVVTALLLCAAAAFAVLVTIRVKTREGTLVVEVSEPGAVVQVFNAKGEVVVQHPAGKEPLVLRVAPGEHKLRIERDGFEIYSKEITIAAGGKQFVKAQVEPDGLAEGTPSTTAKPRASQGRADEFRDRQRLAQAHRRQGDAFRAKGEFDQAIASYREALTLQPSAIDLRLAQTEALCLRARERGEAKRFAQALDDCGEAIQLYPDDPIPYYVRGVLRLHLGNRDCDGAIADLTRAIDLCVTAPEKAIPTGHIHTFGIQPFPALSARFAAYKMKRDFDRALADLNEAMRGYGSSIHWSFRADMYRQKGDWERAIHDCDKAIQVHASTANDPETGGACAYYCRALCWGLLGHTDEALKDLQAGAQHGDRQLFELNMLAWCLATCPDAKVRNPSRAIEVAKESLARAGRTPGYDLAVQANPWTTLGVAQYRAGNWRDSIEALTRSVELTSGGEPCDWIFLAMTHWQAGHKEEARRWYDRAQQWMANNKLPDEELPRFRAEAAAVLGLPADPKPGAKAGAVKTPQEKSTGKE